MRIRDDNNGTPDEVGTGDAAGMSGPVVAFWIGVVAAVLGHAFFVLAAFGAWLLFALPIHVICVWGCGNLAKNRGRDPMLGYALGVWFGLVGILATFMLDDYSKR